MRWFSKYLNEIKEREKIGLSPKPIDSGELLEEIITNILDIKLTKFKPSLKEMTSNTNHLVSY